MHGANTGLQTKKARLPGRGTTPFGRSVCRDIRLRPGEETVGGGTRPGTDGGLF